MEGNETIPGEGKSFDKGLEARSSRARVGMTRTCVWGQIREWRELPEIKRRHGEKTCYHRLKECELLLRCYETIERF